MLKRTQVLFEDWQVDYMKRSAELFDLSFSEVARIFVSEAILCVFFSLEPKKKIGIDKEELSRMKKQFLNSGTTMQERYKILSRIYFEARKAAEHKFVKT